MAMSKIAFLRMRREESTRLHDERERRRAAAIEKWRGAMRIELTYPVVRRAQRV